MKFQISSLYGAPRAPYRGRIWFKIKKRVHTWNKVIKGFRSTKEDLLANVLFYSCKGNRNSEHIFLSFFFSSVTILLVVYWLSSRFLYQAKLCECICFIFMGWRFYLLVKSKILYNDLSSRNNWFQLSVTNFRWATIFSSYYTLL